MIVKLRPLDLGFLNSQERKLLRLLILNGFRLDLEFEIEPVNEYVVLSLVMHQLNLHKVTHLVDPELLYTLYEEVDDRLFSQILR